MPTDANGLSLDYGWGTPAERMAFAKAMDIDLKAMSVNVLHGILAATMAGTRGDSLAHPDMKGEGDRMVCPLAYKLARGAGIDPAGFLLLEKLKCYVTIGVRQWRGKLGFCSHSGGLEMQAPLADGIVWRGGWPGPHGRAIASVLSLDTDIHAIPDIIKSSLRGRTLGQVVDHPLLDGDLVIRAVALEDDEDEPGGVDIRFTTNPPLVRLADAAAAYRTLKGGTHAEPPGP